MIRDRRKFFLGAAGLASFLIVLAVWLSPVFDGRSGLEWADDFFNQLSKQSAYYLPELCNQASALQGRIVAVSWPAGDAAEASRAARVLSSAGGQATADQAQVRLKGDAGALAQALLADAEQVFGGDTAALECRYGLGAKEVLYAWWTAFGAIYKQFIREGDRPASDFASAMRTRVCEPVYNFAGIEPLAVLSAPGRLAFLLAFYLGYTVWYGFSILYLFEGLGIVLRKREKREA